MHFVRKIHPGPPCLEEEKLKNAGTYRCEGVIQRLKAEFHDKCYICEQRALTAINVEHFRPHMQNIDRKFDWSNLFYSCSHCNNLKNANYQYILDCTDPNADINNKIKHRIGYMPKEVVKLEATSDDFETLETLDLLNAVYNGAHTETKDIEASNLRDKILEEINVFNKLLHDWIKEPENGELKNYLDMQIRSRLGNHSEFASFKRSMILDSDYFRPLFQNAF